ncbi:MAG: FecR domain-containing protein [Spirochaetales bacterium]|nr:FecR domain-containing protein [Spirochaetales bacterium]
MKSFLLLLTGICLIGISCKTSGKADYLLVTFAPADAVLIRGTARSQLKTGMVLKPADSLQTGQNPVDLQNSYGGSIRLGPLTIFSVQALLGEGLQVQLQKGSLLARLKKGEKGQRFSVVTPTAIAGVRGTTFKVEVDEQGTAGLRVMEGQVALAPYLPSATETTQKELAAQETVVEGPARASLTPAAVAELTRVKTAAEAGEDVALKLSSASVVVEAHPVSKQEEMEARTLVAVDAELARDASQGKDNAALVSRAYDEQVDRAVEAMKKDAPSLSEAELQKEYATLETAVLRSGEQKKGVTVAQAGSSVIMHTPDGIVRLSISDIQYIDLNY